MAIQLFIGVPGSGKTQAMQDTIRMNCENNRFLCIDRANEWLADSPRWRGEQVPRVAVPADMEFDPQFYERSGLYIFDNTWEPIDVASHARLLGNCVYVDDEIDLSATYKGWLENPIRDFVHRGRHLPNAEGEPCVVHVMGAARRVQNLHSDLTSMADEALVFRIQGMHTMKRIEKEGWLSPEQIQVAQYMPDLNFFRWTNRGTISPGHLEPAFK